MPAAEGGSIGAAGRAEYPWERALGARPLARGETEFRVWAPAATEIRLLLGSGRGAESLALEHAGYGVYETTAAVGPGADYCYLVDGRRLPDPAARSQPDGLLGPSRVYAPDTRDAPGPGERDRFHPAPLRDQVLYELHIGTFSREGTFDGAIPYLPTLAELGITAIEVMPIGEFPGVRGWGYDGVYLSAAQSSYGGPEGFQRLLEAAHATGLAVILDVVYNHVGASGAPALRAFGPYFTSAHETPWGEAINYDGADCDPVREWVLQSAEGWVRDFGVDGLRLDAIHAIFDASAEHIVAAIARRVHAVDPDALVIAESALNDPVVLRPRSQGGYGCDASWADDFHHSLRTLLTDEHDGYYADYGKIEDLAKAWRRPYVYDGGYSSARRRRFGAPAGDVPPERFVVYSQNHDQVGNRAFGDRMPAQARLLAAFCTLLSPFTPLLFMGEEYGEGAPFQFFSDHIDGRIAEATRAGRRAEFAAFASFDREIPDPQSIQTYEASTLTRGADPRVTRRYAELLALRRGALAPLDGDAVAFAPGERWLRITRGVHELVCNFDRVPVTLAVHDRRLVFTTTDATELRQGKIRLEPLSGAVLATDRKVTT